VAGNGSVGFGSREASESNLQHAVFARSLAWERRQVQRSFVDVVFTRPIRLRSGQAAEAPLFHGGG
jgi:hypothetical protein